MADLGSTGHQRHLLSWLSGFTKLTAYVGLSGGRIFSRVLFVNLNRL